MPRIEWSAKDDLMPQFEGPWTEREAEAHREWARMKREKEASNAQ